MKILLLACPRHGQLKQTAHRFNGLISSLDQVGLWGRYYALHSADQLRSILLVEKPDIVYSANLTTVCGAKERVSIHKILADGGVPYIGSTAEVLKSVLSKSTLKDEWRIKGLQTPASILLTATKPVTDDLKNFVNEVGFPLLIKPDREGNSRGLEENSIVFEYRTLKRKIRDLLEKYEFVLVEKFLTGDSVQEFTVAMIGNGTNNILMPAQIKLKVKKEHRLITTSDKEEHKTTATPVVDEKLKAQLVEFASQAFEIAGVKDYARCDLMMIDGSLYAIEINGLPMIPDKWFEVCASGAGLNAIQYVLAIILAGIVRNIRSGIGNLEIPDEIRNNLPEQVFNTLTKGM